MAGYPPGILDPAVYLLMLNKFSRRLRRRGKRTGKWVRKGGSVGREDSGEGMKGRGYKEEREGVCSMGSGGRPWGGVVSILQGDGRPCRAPK